ncbi:MAG: hypothetical protein NVSMB51_20640 [Solirubrobacteraceae bacterium]
MRRLLLGALWLAAAVTAGLVLAGGRADGSSAYEVDAIFDTAKGIIPGQLVKIAGARVGTVKDVSLTADFKARIEMSIDRRFAPFHSDAGCAIKPEGLIAENFVDCSPGTPAGRLLDAQGGHAPTVPVSRNSEPVALTDLFNIWNTPTADRLRVLINEFGGGLAGRGEDLNALIHRANPSLTVARRAIALVNRQRAQLQRIVANTDPVVAQLAARSRQVQRFIDNAAAVTRTTAAHAGPLAAAIQRLPPLLAAARPALGALNALTRDGAPLLANLRDAAGPLNRLTSDVHPFAGAAIPALQQLAPALGATTVTLRDGAPLVGRLRTFAREANPIGQSLNELLINLRDRGGVEGLLTFLYNSAAASSRYDSISHLIPSHVLINNCTNYSVTPVDGCSAHFAGAQPQASRRASRHLSRAPATPTANQAPLVSTPGGASVAPTPGPAPAAPPAPAGAGASAPAATAPAAGPPAPARPTTPVKSLLDYLFK